MDSETFMSEVENPENPPPPGETQTFHIVRHLRSCNNLINDLKLSRLRNFADPSLALWGILSGLAKDQDIINPFHNTVYVSCLVRTWMTAILAYLPHCERNTINLRISPFIKEEHHRYLKKLDLGNFPLEFEAQIQRLKQFLDFLTLLHKVLQKHFQNSTESVIHKIQTKLETIMGKAMNIHFHFVSKESATQDIYIHYHYEDYRLTKSSSNQPKLFHPYEIQETRESVFSLQTESPPPVMNPLMVGGFYLGEKEKQYIRQALYAFAEQETTKTKYAEVVVFDNTQSQFPPLQIQQQSLPEKKGFLYGKKAKPTIRPYIDYFGTEGIWQFMLWVRTVVKDTHPDIYVVSHANLMRQSLVDICHIRNAQVVNKKTLSKCHRDLEQIQNQNIWELSFTVEVPKKTDTMLLSQVIVRAGADPPNQKSTNSLGLPQELTCSQTDLTENAILFTKDIPRLKSYYKRECPKRAYFFKNQSQLCQDYEKAIREKEKEKENQWFNRPISRNETYNPLSKPSLSNGEQHVLNVDDDDESNLLKYRMGGRGPKTRRVRKHQASFFPRRHPTQKRGTRRNRLTQRKNHSTRKR